MDDICKLFFVHWNPADINKLDPITPNPDKTFKKTCHSSKLSDDYNCISTERNSILSKAINFNISRNSPSRPLQFRFLAAILGSTMEAQNNWCIYHEIIRPYRGAGSIIETLILTFLIQSVDFDRFWTSSRACRHPKIFIYICSYLIRG